MTCKAVILLTRRADTSHEEFAAWWLGEHAPLAKQLPGVRRAVFNLVDAPADGDPDGVSELWFDSLDDFTAAYATEIGQAVVADTLAHVASRQRMFVTEHPLTP
ncbi:MAG: EthD family reductase [Actinobacteria bacterium]|nr:EthD family reductase [Actinomycetota bacterium]